MATVTSHARNRRRIPIQLVAWLVAVVVLAVVAALLYAGSAVHNTSLLVAAAAPTVGAPAATLPDSVSARWREPSQPSAVAPIGAGTVIVGSVHGITGHDGATGAERWHYLRSTATLCDWTTVNDMVIAVFRTDEGCDEALALNAGTGARVWYRSVNYSPDVTLQSTDQITLASTPTGIVALGTTGSGTRWRYSPPRGCRLTDTAAGDVGVALITSCDGGATTLQVLDGFSGKQHWTAALGSSAARVIGLDGTVTVLTPGAGGALSVFDRDGTGIASVINPAFATVPSTATPLARLVGERLLVFTGTAVLAVDTTTSAVSWTTPASAAPAVLTSGVAVLDGDVVTTRDPLTGAVLNQTDLAGVAAPTGGQLTEVGDTLVISGDGVVAAYR